MAGLADTLAALKRAPRPTSPERSSPAGRLREVAGLQPNPGDLRMLLYTPHALAPGAPLVVVLHGCTQTATAYAEGAGWLTLADRAGFAVLCPEQKRGNNPNLCFNWFQPEDTARGAGEAASIHAMVRQAVAEHQLDPKRVFITGLSAGGAMSGVMLATYPETFAAGAIVAGLPFAAASNMQEAFMAMFQGVVRPPRDWGDRVRAASDWTGPWPAVSIWHGDADATVKPSAAEALAQQWTDVHGLRGPGETAVSSDGRTYRVWRSSEGEPVVTLHRIAGMGHGTPLGTTGEDALGVAGPFLLDVGVSSTSEIARSWDLIAASTPGSVQPRAAPTLTRPSPTAGPRLRAVVPDRPGPAEVIAKALRGAGLLK